MEDEVRVGEQEVEVSVPKVQNGEGVCETEVTQGACTVVVERAVVAQGDRV